MKQNKGLGEKKQCDINVVIPQLLCLDASDTDKITKGKEYTPMFVGKMVCRLIDDNNEIAYLARNRFKEIEA